eukprot:gene32690-55341_t
MTPLGHASAVAPNVAAAERQGGEMEICTDGLVAVGLKRPLALRIAAACAPPATGTGQAVGSAPPQHLSPTRTDALDLLDRWETLEEDEASVGAVTPVTPPGATGLSGREMMARNPASRGAVVPVPGLTE